MRLSVGKGFYRLSAGSYQIPEANLVSPHENANLRAYEGWAYCAHTPGKEIFLAYFEKDAPQAQIRGARLNSLYKADWFDPRTGTYASAGTLRSSVIGIIQLPAVPTNADWALRLSYFGPAPSASAAAHVGNYTIGAE
jgi:hypothetical protein